MAVVGFIIGIAVGIVAGYVICLFVDYKVN